MTKVIFKKQLRIRAYKVYALRHLLENKVKDMFMLHSINLKTFRRSLAIAAIGLLAAGATWAEYPDRPIKYVLGAGAGSGPDALMRLVLQDVGKRLGTPFVIENRTGGGGLIAMQAIANATPDGYTLGHGNVQTLAISPGLSKASRAEAERVQLIVQFGYTPNLLSVSPTLPVKSVRELIAYAKANPGQLTYGSAGNGTSGHVGTELFKSLTGTNIVHAPYKSAPAAVNDVIAGHVDMVFDNLAGSMPLAKNGRLKALAITSLKRSPLLPDVPTVSESGVPNFEVIAWSGIVAPRGLPLAIVQKINMAVNESLKDPNVVRGMQALGYEAVGGTPEQFVNWVAKERTKWGGVIKSSGATTD